MTDKKKVREAVCRAYAHAVSTPSGSSCCGSEQKGAAAKLAGYGQDELDALPTEAVENSFGCGNPLAFSGVTEGETVLDLGSGAGIDLLLAAKMVGPAGRVIGVDMTDAMIEKARTTIAEAGATNVEVRKGLIEELPVESDSVDWVISNCVINLSPEKDKVFAEIARVLKPGGRMLVSDLVAEDLPAIVRDSMDLYCSCVSGAISEDDYCAGLRHAGLVDVEVRERLHYDAAQIKALIASDIKLPVDPAGCGCGCGGEATVASAGEIAQACQGKVWSAKIAARKAAG